MRGGRGFGATLRAILASPKTFFSAGEEDATAQGSPLVFASAVGAIGSGLAGLVSCLIAGDSAHAITAALAAAIASAIFTPLGVAVSAAVAHGVLRLVGGATRPYRDTLAGLAYATAPGVFSFVPIAGPIVGGVWQLVLGALALNGVHRSGVARALGAVLAGPLFFVALALGLRLRVVEAFKIPSGAMVPTILVGDHVFVNKLAYRAPFGDGAPAPGDVVVFRFPQNRDQDFVKRVVAVGGDTVEYIDGRPIVNGKLAPECYVGAYPGADHEQQLYVEFLAGRPHLALYDHEHDKRACAADADCGDGRACRVGVCGVPQGPYHVRPGEFWVSGDNRDNTYDSRAWNGGLGGGVPNDDAKGRVTIVWMSFRPDGSVAQDRLFVNVNGAPSLPSSAPAAARDALSACLAKGPPR